MLPGPASLYETSTGIWAGCLIGHPQDRPPSKQKNQGCTGWQATVLSRPVRAAGSLSRNQALAVLMGALTSFHVTSKQVLGQLLECSIFAFWTSPRTGRRKQEGTGQAQGGHLPLSGLWAPQAACCASRPWLTGALINP